MHFVEKYRSTEVNAVSLEELQKEHLNKKDNFKQYKDI